MFETVFAEIFGKYFPKLGKNDFQYFFKNEETTFDLSKVKGVTAKDISMLINPKNKKDSLVGIRRAQLENPYQIEYYDVYFAVFAKMIDNILEEHPSLNKKLSQIAKSEG